MRLAEISKVIDGAKIIEKNGFVRTGDIEFFDLSADSRSASQGDLFFCLSGGNLDGHAFASEAIKKGVCALVVEKELDLDIPQILVPSTRKAVSLMSSHFYGNPEKKLKIIGITGTNGKTTTSYLLSSILKSAGKNVGVIGTLGIYYGKKQIAPELTTPDPIYLYSTLLDMVANGVEYVVMEVSAHAIYFQKDAACEYAACIFTNFSQDHLDFFENLKKYKEVKIELFRSSRCPFAIINGDDEVGREIIKARANLPERRTLSYGLETPTDAFAVMTDEKISSSEFMLNLLDKLGRVTLPMTGRHNVYNALAAATCAFALGIDMSAIVLGLRGIKPVSGRLERVAKYAGADIFVDFAHTPDGLEKSIAALLPYRKKRLICVFGCGGNRDTSKRALMGETAAKLADFTIITADNPRYEDPLDIILQIERGFRRFSTKYVVVPDREKAIERAIKMLNRGDILLIAGKGGEIYQEIMGIKYAFNDNAIIRKVIARICEKPSI